MTTTMRQRQRKDRKNTHDARGNMHLIWVRKSNTSLEKNGSYGALYPSNQLLLRISTGYNSECSAAAEKEIFKLGLFSNHPKYATNKWVVPLIKRIE